MLMVEAPSAAIATQSRAASRELEQSRSTARAEAAWSSWREFRRQLGQRGPSEVPRMAVGRRSTSKLISCETIARRIAQTVLQAPALALAIAVQPSIRTITSNSSKTSKVRPAIGRLSKRKPRGMYRRGAQAHRRKTSHRA